jgi:putative nucleotidyltransferase with HDIG domain
MDPELRRNRKQMLKHFLALSKYSYWNAEHSVEVARLARDFGKVLNFDTAVILKAAFTHDVGKTGVPKQVLHKAGKLDQEERFVMNTHAAASVDKLDSLSGEHAKIAKIAAGYHHTKPSELDNLYNSGDLSADEVELVKIITICDIFEALVSEKRPYKQAMTKFDALELMSKIEIVDAHFYEKFSHWQTTHFTNEYRLPYVEKERARLDRKYNLSN